VTGPTATGWSQLRRRPIRASFQVYSRPGCQHVPLVTVGLYDTTLRSNDREGPTLIMQIARSWRAAAAGLAIGVVGVLSVAGATASAEPLFPPRPNPTPVPAPTPAGPLAPQTIAVAPGSVGNTVPGAAPPAAPLPLSSALAPAGRATTTAAPTASAPSQPALPLASSGTLRDYFQSKDIKLEAQHPDGFKALVITLPLPAGWTQVPDPNVPDAFVVTANRSSNSLYTSNAQVVVYKLIGDFDPREAITHGYVDSRQLPAWRSTNALMADFCGLPSSIIEGTYRQDDMTLNTSRRHVIATSGPDKYLVSFAVTTDAAQAVAEAPATDAIINGIRVEAPSPTRNVAPLPPAAVPPSVPPGLPLAAQH
jgi:Probable lipoprotein LpqN